VALVVLLLLIFFMALFCLFLGPLCGLDSHLSFCPLCVLILVLLLILLMPLVFNSYSIVGHVCGFRLC